MRKWFGRFLLICCGVGLALIPIELYLRTATRFSPPIAECDAEIGYRLMQNRTITDNAPGEFRVRYHTNQYRMRYRDISLDKPDGIGRILGLGDSFTFGIGVKDDETYLAALEKLLDRQRDVQVLNTGTGGWGTAEELVYLQDEGLRFDPDLILVGFYVANDPQNNAKSRLFRIAEDGTLERTPLQDLPNLCPSHLGWLSDNPIYRYLADHLATVAWLRSTFDSLRQDNQPKRQTEQNPQPAPQIIENPQTQLTRLIMQEIENTGEAQGIPVVFVMIPALWQLDHPTNSQVVEQWLAICQQDNLQCVDTRRPLLESGLAEDALYFTTDGHWKPAAHRIAAQAVFDYLAAQGLGFRQ
jgi:hypothetical protein